jgi:hypothetical protein
MNIFICWSQSRSKQIASALHDWLPDLLPKEKFFVSSDIEKGALWFEAIRNHLRIADAAIICLTPENIDSPWMHFEVGAIAGKKEESRILTYLFGVSPSDIRGPLTAFQSSNCTKDDTRNLVHALGRMCQKTVTSFDERWPALEMAINGIQSIRVPDLMPGFGAFLNFKTFREPLELCSDQSWLDRYARLVQVREGLEEKKLLVAAKCQHRDSGVYLQLLSDLDNYLRLVKSELIEERRFKRVNGKLDFEDANWVAPEVARICGEIENKVRALGGNVPHSEAGG